MPAGGSVAAQTMRAEVDQLRSALPNYPKRYLYLLMVVTAIDASDRTLLSTVFEDVKRAFDISDTQLGVLTSAFLVVATVSAVPFGFLADRMSRVRLIALGFIPWSLAMFWSAGAGSFSMLLASRLFLGSIEATNGPSTPSLLGDYYPVAQRSRVFGVLTIGGQLGSIIGFLAGGTIATLVGWREAFVVVGVVGVLTGFVVSRLPEPERGLPDALHRAEENLAEAEGADNFELVEVDVATESVRSHVDLRHLSAQQSLVRVLRVPTMWILAASSTVSLFFTSSLGVWLPTYFRRYHGLSAAAAGGLLSVLTVFLIVGVLVGGRHGDRAMTRWGPRSRIVIIAACLAGQFPAWLGLFTSDSLGFGIACIAVVAVFTGYPLGIAAAAFLEIYPSHLRGRAAGVQTILRVVATAAAPVVFGVLSDLYGLRSAWLYTLPTLLAAAGITLIAVRTYPPDLRRAQVDSLLQHRLELIERDVSDVVAECVDAPMASGTARGEPDSYVPYCPPVAERPRFFEGLRDVARDATATPRRAAIGTLCAVAAVTLVLAALPVRAESAGARGSVVARCGVETVVFGHPDAAVESLCRDALRGRSFVFFLSLTVLVVGGVGLARLLVRRSRRLDGRLAKFLTDVTATPNRVCLLAATGVAAFLVVATSRPIPVTTARDGLSVRCGVDTVLRGHPIESVDEACRTAMSSRSTVFVVAALVCLAGIGALVFVWTALPTRARVLRAVASVAAVVSVAVGLSALRPATIEVDDPGSNAPLLVSCGLDSVVGGHPTLAVRDACRREVASSGAALGAAALAGGVGVAALRSISSRKRVLTDWRFT